MASSRILCATILLLAAACRNGGTSTTVATAACDVAASVASDALERAESFADLVVLRDSVQLETTRESVVGQVDLIRRHPDGFVVLDKHVVRRALLFDHTGRFLRSFGTEGDGPGEYRELRDVRVRPNGHVLLLSRGTQKVLEYDAGGNLLAEIDLKLLGIRPDQMALRTTEDGREMLFYNLDGDFAGVSGGRKVVVAGLSDDHKLSYKMSFGDSEPTLKRLFFSAPGFGIRSDGSFWIPKVFELETERYDKSGDFVGFAEDPSTFLPGPHLNAELLADFDRPSDAMDTYLSTTRAFNYLFLDEYSIAAYYSGRTQSAYLIAYTSCGNIVSPHLSSERFPLFNSIRGNDGNVLYVAQAHEADGAIDVPNPAILVYEFSISAAEYAE